MKGAAIWLGRALALLLGIYGLFAFLFGLMSSVADLGPQARLPLNDLSAVVVAPQGLVFCALPSYSRIQVYRVKDGAFLYGWKADTTNGGGFHIGQAETGELQVFDIRGHRVLNYSAAGALLGTEQAPDRAFERNDSNCYQAGLVEACIRGHLGFTRVDIERQGGLNAVISQGLGEWSFGSPFPALLWLLAPLVVFRPWRRMSRA